MGAWVNADAPRGQLLTCHRLPAEQSLKRRCRRRGAKRRRSSKWSANACQAVQTSAAEILEHQEARIGSEEIAERESTAIPDMWRHLADERGDLMAVSDPHQSPPSKYTFKDLYAQMQRFASGLQAVGLQEGDKVSLFSENSSRWLIADQSIMMLGAADAVRGSTGSVDEMSYIIRHSGSCAVVVQDLATLGRILPGISSPPSNSNGSSSHESLQEKLKFIVLLWGDASDESRQDLQCPVYSFNDILARGKVGFQSPSIDGDSLATLVYTSGTTGSPKGVELTHANILYQIANLPYYLGVTAGDRVLSLLPPWHIYERTCSYYVLSRGGQQVYTTIRKFKEDLTMYPPEHFVCVPLVLESLHSKVMQQLRKGSAVKRGLAFFFLAASTSFIKARRIVNGVALKLGRILVYKKIRQALGIRHNVVSGGGSLAAHLDDFYETSPVLACRQRGSRKNVRGSIGLTIPQTSLKIVDPETLEEVEDGQLGLILAKGPGVMRGYLDDPASTQSAMRAGHGFFDTGDLGWRAPTGIPGSNMAGTVVLTGRSKDTIVMSNGENIEPQPIEDACCASSYISHLLVVGQDKRMLGALVAINKEAFEELERIKGPMTLEEKETVIKSEIVQLTGGRPAREKVSSIVILPKPLDREDGTLTQTLKPKRPAVYAKYSKELEQLMQKLR